MRKSSVDAVVIVLCIAVAAVVIQRTGLQLNVGQSAWLNVMNGFGSGSGSTNPPAGSYYFSNSSAVSILASPNSGSKFDHWWIDGYETLPQCRQNPVSLSMTSDHSIAPYFAYVGITSKFDITLNMSTLTLVQGTSGSVRVNVVQLDSYVVTVHLNASIPATNPPLLYTITLPNGNAPYSTVITVNVPLAVPPTAVPAEIVIQGTGDNGQVVLRSLQFNIIAKSTPTPAPTQPTTSWTSLIAVIGVAVVLAFAFTTTHKKAWGRS